MAIPQSRPERVDQILDAALRLFAEKGFHNTRMDDLVDETGLSKGSLYWYFDSKDEIILAVLKRLFDLEFYQMEALLDQDGSAVDRLRALALLTGEEMAALEPMLSIVFEFYSLAGRRPDVRQVLGEYLARYRDGLTRLIEQGQERSEVRPGPPGETAMSIIAVFEGLLVLWALDPASMDWQVQPARALDLLLQGIAAE